MPTLQEKIDKRANTWEQMKAIMERRVDGDFANAEDRESYLRAEREYDALDADIKLEERHMERNDANTRAERPANPLSEASTFEPESEQERAYAKAFSQYIREGATALDSDDQKILRAGFVTDSSFRNAAGVATGAAGGYTVPPEFRRQIIERLQFIASMRQIAEVITTDTGAELPWPTNDDTANEGAILDENTQVSEQDVTFGQASIGAYMYTSKLVRASFQIINDSAFNFDLWLSRALGSRIGRVQNRHFTVGTGDSQPDGVMTSATNAVAAASATEIGYADLVELTESLDPAYLGGGNCRFMTSQAGRKQLRLLVDGDNRPLWQPALTAGTPDSLLGYGVTLNNYVAAPAAASRSLAFGDFREAYLIRDVSDFALLRLTERYADYLQVGFIGFQRSDGTLQDAQAVAVLEHPAA